MGLALTIILLFFLALYILVPMIEDNPPKIKQKAAKNYSSYDNIFTGILVLAFLLNIIGAYMFKGHSSDMSCWFAWGQRMASNGAAAFYAPDYFCDYPPGYLYILNLTARLSDTLNLSEPGMMLVYKLPSIIADIVIAYMLYTTAKKTLSGKSALIVSSIFLLSPIFRLDTMVWGQIESILIALLLATILRICDKKYVSAIVFFVLAVLVKPQALIAAPIILIALIQCKNIKTILISSLAGIAVFWAITMPFSPAWNSYTGFEAFLNALNPVWIIDKYISTLSSYQYFSVNAFNLYGLLGLNWKSLQVPGYEMLFSIINALVLTLGVAGALFILIKVKEPSSKLNLSCYFIYGFIFTFAFKMHERYIILPIIFLLTEYIFTGNKRFLWLFSGFSAVGYLNCFYILLLDQSTGNQPLYSITAAISFIEVVLFVLSLWIIYKDCIACTPYKAIPFSTEKIREKLTNHSNAFLKKFKSKDSIIITIITVVYTITAFSALGNFKAPQSYYQPAVKSDTFIITFEEAETISEINYYCGGGNVSVNPGISFEYSIDGVQWTKIPDTQCKLKAVYFWERTTLEPITAKFLRGTAENIDYRLFEAGFRCTDGSLAQIKSIEGKNQSNYAGIADEQEFVTNKSSYENSTYFDEIYHPRTAYEHLHMQPYYETTHPPLGKLIMSIGIIIFGMTPFGWRCMGVLMGIIMLPMLYMLLKKLFKRTRYSAIGTLLFAFDFMHFSLTRIGTIDSYPVLFIICMYYFMYSFGERAIQWAKGDNISFKKIIIPLTLSGLFMGLGCASKWTAVYASLGLAVEFFVYLYLIYKNSASERRSEFKSFAFKICGICIPVFILMPAIIYILSYLPISMVEGYGNVFEAMWNNQSYMLNYHSELKDTHPYSSEWYSWPFVYRPMWAYKAPSISIGTGEIGCISIFQNPLLSWVGIAAFIYALYNGRKTKDRRVLFLVIGLLAQYLPWAIVSRYALQYHFFASMPFLVCFVIYAMESLENKNKRFIKISNIFSITCLVLFVMFYPIISGVPVSKLYVETMLVWFKPWIFFN